MLRFCEWWSFWCVCQDCIQLGISISWGVAYYSQTLLMHSSSGISIFQLHIYWKPWYPLNERRGNLLLCQKSMWPHLAQCFRRRYLFVCLKNEWPWDHQGAWLDLGRRMSKDRRPVSLGGANDGANEYFHPHPLSLLQFPQLWM